jgi:hypothetical protein
VGEGSTPPAYTLLSRRAAEELILGGGYEYLVGEGHSRSYVRYYCKKLGEELECIRVWWDSWIAEGGGSLFRGSPEEVYCWVLRNDVGVIEARKVLRALKSFAGREIAREKLGEARRSMLRKVLGEDYDILYPED